MKEKTEIEIQLTETIAYSRSSERFESFCVECDAIVEVATTHAASIIAEMPEREIYRRIVDNNAHVIETDRLMVCLNSLKDHHESKEI